MNILNYKVSLLILFNFALSSPQNFTRNNFHQSLVMKNLLKEGQNLNRNSLLQSTSVLKKPTKNLEEAESVRCSKMRLINFRNTLGKKNSCGDVKSTKKSISQKKKIMVVNLVVPEKKTTYNDNNNRSILLGDQSEKIKVKHSVIKKGINEFTSQENAKKDFSASATENLFRQFGNNATTYGVDALNGYKRYQRDTLHIFGEFGKDLADIDDLGSQSIENQQDRGLKKFTTTAITPIRYEYTGLKTPQQPFNLPPRDSQENQRQNLAKPVNKQEDVALKKISTTSKTPTRYEYTGLKAPPQVSTEHKKSDNENNQKNFVKLAEQQGDTGLKKVTVNNKELQQHEYAGLKAYEGALNAYLAGSEEDRRKNLEKAVERYVEEYIEKQLGEELIKNAGVPKTTVFEFSTKTGPKIQTVTTTVAKTSSKVLSPLVKQEAKLLPTIVPKLEVLLRKF